MIFDGNHYLCLYDEDWQKVKDKDRREAEKSGYTAVSSENQEECRQIANELFFSRIRRLQWDIPVLLNIGFGKIYVVTDVDERTEYGSSKIKSRTKPLFMIRVQKTSDNYLYGMK